jgi:uncharacterized membrane protein YhaH (DUF805 family)
MTDIIDSAEMQARRRYLLTNLVRLGSLAAVLAGLAMARQVIPGPAMLGGAIALGGMLGFFFVPALLVRRWKSQGKSQDGKVEK